MRLSKFLYLICGLMLLWQPASAQSLLLDRKHGDDGSAWKLKECAACHVLQRIHQRPPAKNIRSIVQDKGYDSCMGCHGDNGTGRERPCEICHNSSDLPATPHRDGRFQHEFPDLTGDSACVACHDDSDMDGDFQVRQDLTLFPDAQKLMSPYFSGADFCLRCHNRDHQIPGFEIRNRDWRDPLIAMEDNYNHIDFHGHRRGGDGTYTGLRDGYKYSSRVDCTDCHAMHGTENTGLIIDNSAKGVSQLDPALGLDNVPVWTGNGEYAQLCVLCHQMERNSWDSALDTGNGLSGVHQAWGDCRDCHSHGLAGQAGL
ncbi:hypothetical protein [Thiolapillus sp.]